MTTPSPAAVTVDEATVDLEAARALRAKLRSRLANGYDDVSQSELVDAEAAVDHAELRLQGARARARREAEAELENELLQLQEELIELQAAGPSDHTDQARQAILRLVEELHRRDGALDGLRARGQHISARAEDLDRNDISVAARIHASSDTHRYVKAVVAEAVKAMEPYTKHLAAIDRDALAVLSRFSAPGAAMPLVFTAGK